MMTPSVYPEVSEGGLAQQESMSEKGHFEFICFQGTVKVFLAHVIVLGRRLVSTLASESQTSKSEKQKGCSTKLSAVYVQLSSRA